MQATLDITIPVSFTTNAVTEIKRLMSQNGFDTTQVLRVGVKGGGCTGMTYVLGFDAPTEKDGHFEMRVFPVSWKNRMVFI